MSTFAANDGRRRRADAERSIAAILDAAIDVLGERPAASMGEIARAAGVSRQTVYAHFPSREQLLAAVQQRALAETVAAIDAARPQDGPAPAALERVVVASWRTLARHARLIDSLTALHEPEQLERLHQPILERLARIVRRGQRSGAFDQHLPLDWTLAALLALFHATAREVSAGRISADDAAATLARAVPRLLASDRRVR